MNVGFASAKHLDRNTQGEHEFSLFGNTVRSTLFKSDILVMQHEKKAAVRNVTEATAVAASVESRKRRQNNNNEKSKPSSPSSNNAAPNLMEPINAHQTEDPRLTAMNRSRSVIDKAPSSSSLTAFRESNPRLDFQKLSASVQAEIIQDIHGDVIEKLRKYKTCIACGDLYRDWDSLGKHLCRWHPGTLANEVTNPVTGSISYGWSCCGAPLRCTTKSTSCVADGCCSCDHTDVSFVKDRYNVVRLPTVLVNAMKIPPSHISTLSTQQHAQSINDVKNFECGILCATYKTYRTPVDVFIPKNDYGSNSRTLAAKKSKIQHLVGEEGLDVISLFNNAANSAIAATVLPPLSTRKRKCDEDIKSNCFVFRGETNNNNGGSASNHYAAFRTLMN
jgi:hypothetical protein